MSLRVISRTNTDASKVRYLGDADPYGADAVEGDTLRATGARSLGGVLLWHGLWSQLGIDTALRRLLGPQKFITNVERVLFALVANRALARSSKLAATEWAALDVAAPGRGCPGLPQPAGSRA